MKLPKFVGAAMIAAAVSVSVAACGGGDDSNAIPTVDQSTTAAASASGSSDVTDADTPPSVETLNKMLTTALDADTPNSEKTQLVQNSEKDPNIFNKLVKAKEANPGVTYSLRGPVTPNGPNKAKVRVTVKLPNQSPTSLDAQIVFDNGRWKLASSSVCPLLTANNITSAMCPTSTSTSTSSTS